MRIVETIPDELDEYEFDEDEEEEEDVERDKEVAAEDDQDDDGIARGCESEASSLGVLTTNVNVADVPKEPKMPPSSYLMFVHKKRATMQGSVTEVAASLRKLWNEIDPIEKQTLEEKAKAEMEQYLRDKKEFVACKSFTQESQTRETFPLLWAGNDLRKSGV